MFNRSIAPTVTTRAASLGSFSCAASAKDTGAIHQVKQIKLAMLNDQQRLFLVGKDETVHGNLNFRMDSPVSSGLPRYAGIPGDNDFEKVELTERNALLMHSATKTAAQPSVYLTAG